MIQSKKSYAYITAIHVIICVLSIPYLIAQAAGSWSKSGSNTSSNYLLLAFFIAIGFPIIGLFQYYFCKEFPNKANAYLWASIIEFTLLILVIFYIGNSLG